MHAEAWPEAVGSIDAATARELGAEVVQAWREVAQAQARFTERVRRFDLVDGYAVSGSLSCAAWLRHHCRMTFSQASQQVMVARKLDDLEQTRQAYSQGEISYQHSATIAACARKLGAEVVQPREKILVDAAKAMDPWRLGMVTKHLEHMADPDGSLDWFDREHERRRLEVHQLQDGMYSLRGLFDPEAGAKIAGGLALAMGPPEPGDERSTGQRRADALLEVFEQSFQKPLVTVVTRLDTLEGRAGSPGAEIREERVLPAATVRRLACDAQQQEGDVCGDGIHVELSDLQQTVSPKLRRMVELRDRHCRYGDCRRPPHMCDVHHIKHRADGGGNEIENLVLICRPTTAGPTRGSKPSPGASTESCWLSLRRSRSAARRSP